MKKYQFLIVWTIITIVTLPVSGQSDLKNFFSSDKVKDIVGAIVPQKNLTIETLEGTWHYSGSACKFSSDDLLKKAGGELAASKIEEKLDGVYSKLGLTSENCSYTFNSDSTFISKFSKQETKGTFSIDTEKEYNVTFKYQLMKLINLTSVEARIEISSDKIQILFNADKLLKLLSLGASTQNTTLQTIGTLANEYDGALVGFELKR